MSLNRSKRSSRSASRTEDLNEIHPDQVIRLNVGGYRYETKFGSINKIPGNRLVEIVEAYRSRIDKGEEIFVDRDGHSFRYILQFLRTLSAQLMPRKLNEIQEVLKEAQYFNLQPLITTLNEHIMTYPFVPGDIVKFNSEAISGSWDFSELYGRQMTVSMEGKGFGPDPDNIDMNDRKQALSTIRGRIVELTEHMAKVLVPKRSEYRMQRELMIKMEDREEPLMDNVEVYVMLGALTKIE